MNMDEGIWEQLNKREEDEGDTGDTGRANVVPLRTIIGGKGPPGSDWLSPLPDGTIFLARPIKHQGMPFLDMYRIANRSKRGILLDTILAKETSFWVDPIVFCRTIELFEILERGSE
jgi:hypothetical protein